MKKRAKFDKGLLLLVLIVFIAAFSAVFLYLQIRTDKIADAVKKGELIKLLFVIGDKEQLLFSEVFLYNPETNKGAIFDIPGDTGVIYESLERFDRIDVQYDGSKIGGFRQKVEELMGEAIPYYIHLYPEDIPRIVDLFDGMELFIANPVDIVSADKTVLLPSGSLVLDGSKAMCYALYEEEGEEGIEKIGRRQNFFQALLHELGTHSDLLRRDDVFSLMRSAIKTNISVRALSTFLSEMAKLDIEHIVSLRVLGAKRTVDEQELLFPHYDGRLLKETVKQTFESLANSNIISDEELSITIEILNGTDQNGLASRTAQVYQSFGYNIDNIGNAESTDTEYTLIIDRVGDIATAQRVADIIKCIRIETKPFAAAADNAEGTGPIDVTIILGKDFDGRNCKN